jgi:4-hydroxy-tetrahydrodipicolinate synthase
LIKAVFIETNPIPVKTAMGLLGMCEPDLRLPLCAMSPENLEKLKAALKEYGLL